MAHALACFGPDRLMFGSDWPVCLLAADYDAVTTTAEILLADLDAVDRQAVFGDTARRIYRLTPAEPPTAAGREPARR